MNAPLASRPGVRRSLGRWLPPILVDSLQRLRGPHLYPSYFDALQHSGSAYNSSELAEVVVRKTIETIPIIDSGRLPQVAQKSLQALAMLFSDQVNRVATVLDFGGAGGLTYFVARSVLPIDMPLRWIVVETEEMVAAARSSGLESRELRFFSGLEQALRFEAPTAILASSSLQYVPNPIKTLTALTSTHAPTICITRTPVHAGPAPVFVRQRSSLGSNGPGTSTFSGAHATVFYPATLVSHDELVKSLEHGGYRVKYSLLEEKLPWNLFGVPADQISIVAKRLSA